MPDIGFEGKHRGCLVVLIIYGQTPYLIINTVKMSKRWRSPLANDVRWTALTRYLEDGAVPIDNNWVENQIRPWAVGRSYHL